MRRKSVILDERINSSSSIMRQRYQKPENSREAERVHDGDASNTALIQVEIPVLSTARKQTSHSTHRRAR